MTSHSDQKLQTVRTRMAPSPTGDMHVGSMAILLKNYAFAKGRGGQFVMRVEDTDQEREVPGARQRILEVVKAYGLDWDEGPDKGGEYGPYTQSERLDIYRDHAQQLVEAGKAYYCFCSKDRLEQVREQQRKDHQPPRYDRHCRSLSAEEVNSKKEAGESFVIRLKVPDHHPVVFNDLLRGEIEINSDQVDDQVLLKSDGFPTYHLAVVVDDHLMKITHIMRGEEWITSTPKHVLLYQAFGWELPVFAHIPVFLNPDGKGKMSKRKGTVSAQSFLDKGYLPEALLNFFMILGWTPQDQRDIVSLEEYIQEFDPRDVSSNSVVFDLNKLGWLNGQYIRSLDDDLLTTKLKPFLPADFPDQLMKKVLPLVKERLVTLGDFAELTDFFYQSIEIPMELLLKRSEASAVAGQLKQVIESLQAIDDWSVTALETVIRSLQEKNDWKKKQFFMMTRVAVTGRAATPPLFETMEVIGKEEVLNRFQQALAQIQS